MMNAQMKLPFEDTNGAATAANDNRPPINEHEAYFREFHAANPHVYDLVEKLVMEKIASGRPRYGMKSIFEIIRWDYPVNTTGGSYKLKNALAPYYTRLFNKLNPEVEGFLTIAPIRKVTG